LAESQRPDDRVSVRDDGRRLDGRGTLNKPSRRRPRARPVESRIA
jgi:hypothetical protein